MTDQYICPECFTIGEQGWCRLCAADGRWREMLVYQPRAGTVIEPGTMRIEADLSGPAAEVRPLSFYSGVPPRRLSSGLPDVDRVLGGGFVPGSVVVLGGDPGLGKSTLWLQIAASVYRVLVIAGEEPPARIAERAVRLGVPNEANADDPGLCGVYLTTETEVERLDEAIRRYDLLIVDSVNTLRSSAATPGPTAQLVESTRYLIGLARRDLVPMLLIAQVTKDGSLAGPRAIEHLVDVVLWLEDCAELRGEDWRPDGFRLLRPSKNRYGTTAGRAVFRMTAAGLRPIGAQGVL